MHIEVSPIDRLMKCLNKIEVFICTCLSLLFKELVVKHETSCVCVCVCVCARARVCVCVPPIVLEVDEKALAVITTSSGYTIWMIHWGSSLSRIMISHLYHVISHHWDRNNTQTVCRTNISKRPLSVCVCVCLCVCVCDEWLKLTFRLHPSHYLQVSSTKDESRFQLRMVIEDETMFCILISCLDIYCLCEMVAHFQSCHSFMGTLVAQNR